MNNYSKGLQENIITVLVCKDENFSLFANTIDVSLFDNKYYRRIVEKCIQYYNEYKQAPKLHVVDLLEKELLSDEGQIYKTIISNVFENADNININFVISELEKFVKSQKLKIAIKRAYEEVETGNVDIAENIVTEALKTKISLFDRGLKLDEIPSVLLEKEEEEDENIIYTGIKHLDVFGHYPYKKELYILLAPSGYGKTWFLVHLAKHALMQGKKVLYLSLEIREDKLAKRILQSLFSLQFFKVTEDIMITTFVEDEKGYLLKINTKNIVSNRDFSYAIEKLKLFGNKNLIIKGFPSGTLSLKQLVAYLDNLKDSEGFVPDIILLDYMDLMSMDIERLRLDIGRTAVDLRGIADERNVAMVTVTQTNREAENVRLVTRKHLAEDFSRIRTADIFITYNRTKFEEKYGLARLYVDKSRNNKDGLVVVISQNYSIGQFCLSSALIDDDYYDKIEKGGLT